MLIDEFTAERCYLQMLHKDAFNNSVVVSKAVNENSLRATVTGNAILYLQIGDQVSMLILYH